MNEDVIRMVVNNLREEIAAEPRTPGESAPYAFHEEWARDHSEWEKRVTAWRTVLGPMLIRRELEGAEL